jgi:hypothetical protein
MIENNLREKNGKRSLPMPLSILQDSLALELCRRASVSWPEMKPRTVEEIEDESAGFQSPTDAHQDRFPRLESI